MIKQHKKFTAVVIQSGRKIIKPRQQRINCENQHTTIPLWYYLFFSLCISPIYRRLYMASTPIHAPHDEDMLKTKNTDKEFVTPLPNNILIRLQSGAFRSLCEHLRKHSDEVQNIDLMGLSGFCRNCLAKVLYQPCHAFDHVTTNISNLYLLFYHQSGS